MKDNRRLFLDVHAIQTVPHRISIGTIPAVQRQLSMVV